LPARTADARLKRLSREGAKAQLCIEQTVTVIRTCGEKEALRLAGIGYVEVVAAEMSAAELRQVVENLVRRDAA
jgi:hypothetical protein